MRGGRRLGVRRASGFTNHGLNGAALERLPASLMWDFADASGRRGIPPRMRRGRTRSGWPRHRSRGRRNEARCEGQQRLGCQKTGATKGSSGRPPPLGRRSGETSLLSREQWLPSRTGALGPARGRSRGVVQRSREPAPITSEGPMPGVLPLPVRAFAVLPEAVRIATSSPASRMSSFGRCPGARSARSMSLSQ